MKEELNSNHICVLKTESFLDHTVAVNALTENGIPFYKQMETATGLKIDMTLQQMGSGVCYYILVPERFLEEAKQILSELPIDHEDNSVFYNFAAIEKEQSGWGLYFRVLLSIMAFIFIAMLLKIFK